MLGSHTVCMQLEIISAAQTSCDITLQCMYVQGRFWRLTIRLRETRVSEHRRFLEDWLTGEARQCQPTVLLGCLS